MAKIQIEFFNTCSCCANVLLNTTPYERKKNERKTYGNS